MGDQEDVSPCPDSPASASSSSPTSVLMEELERLHAKANATLQEYSEVARTVDDMSLQAKYNAGLADILVAEATVRQDLWQEHALALNHATPTTDTTTRLSTTSTASWEARILALENTHDEEKGTLRDEIKDLRKKLKVERASHTRDTNLNDKTIKRLERKIAAAEKNDKTTASEDALRADRDAEVKKREALTKELEALKAEVRARAKPAAVPVVSVPVPVLTVRASPKRSPSRSSRQRSQRTLTREPALRELKLNFVNNTPDKPVKSTKANAEVRSAEKTSQPSMTDDSPLVFMPRRKRKRDASEQRPSEQPARRVSGARRALDSTAAGTATATASSSAMREPSLLRGASMLRGASVASRRPKRKTFVDDECIAQTPFTMKRDMSRAREQKPAAATTTLPPPFLNLNFSPLKLSYE